MKEIKAYVHSSRIADVIEHGGGAASPDGVAGTAPRGRRVAALVYWGRAEGESPMCHRGA